MNKTDFICLLKKNGLYIDDPVYLSYLFDKFNKKYVSDFVSILKEKRPALIHDVWSVYLYGDNILKYVYLKKRADVKNNERREGSDQKKDNNRFNSSLSRARSRIFELASCNEFHHFCTFTVNENYKDRNDLHKIRTDLAQLFRNLNRDRTDGQKIKYLIIPEQHKKGGWHLHGLVGGLSPFLTEFSAKDRIPLKLKKMIKNGQKVYNFERYANKFGFFTATDIRDPSACSAYLTKYITKEMGKTLLEKGEHLFFASQGLKGRETLVSYSGDVPPFDEWDFENEYVKIKTVLLSEKTDRKN